MEEYKDFKDFIGRYKERVYMRICDYIPDDDTTFMNGIMRCYVDRKGQYRRPSYLMLWNMLYGGKESEAILPAAVQQASEDWILMHDDILDQNALRRGGPSAHVMYGTEYAIIGGDALHVVMWRMIRDAANGLGDRSGRYFDKVYDILFRTIYGQYLDVRLVKEFNIGNFTEEDYYRSIHMKSAYYSVYGPMQCGAIIAGRGDNETLERIERYGTYAGYAFQIRDDILDCTSTEESLGKSIGNDVKEGTKTLILLHAVQNASQNVLSRLNEVYSKRSGEKSRDDIRFVLDTFAELGSIRYAEERAGDFADRAIAEFDRMESGIPESNLKRIARESIGYAARRKE